MISGRIYHDWHGSDLESVMDGQLLLLCLFVRSSWDPKEQVERLIMSGDIANENYLNMMLEEFKRWANRIASENFACYRDSFTCIASKSSEVLHFEEALGAATKGIGDIIKLIQNKQEEEISKIIITTEHLKSIAGWFSKQRPFSSSKDVPLALFKNVKYSPERHKEHSLRISGMNKQDIMRFVEEGKFADVIEFLVEPLDAHVNSELLADIIQKLVITSTDVSSAEAYWEHLRQAESEMRNAGLTPILFVEKPTSPDWIWEWTTTDDYGTSKRPSDLRLSQDKSYSGIGSYLGNFNNVPVFSAPIPRGASYVLAKEALNEIYFTEFHNEIYVEATFEEESDKKGLGELRLVWASEIKLKEYPAVRLKYQ